MLDTPITYNLARAEAPEWSSSLCLPFWSYHNQPSLIRELTLLACSGDCKGNRDSIVDVSSTPLCVSSNVSVIAAVCD